MSIVIREKNVLNSIVVDATKAESTALAKEKASAVKGPATKREVLRIAFYNNFYACMVQLDDMITFLTAAAGKLNATVLASKIKDWKK